MAQINFGAGPQGAPPTEEQKDLIRAALDLFSTADHDKLDAIEAGADVTDTTNVVASLTAGTNITIEADGTISSTDTLLSNEQVQDIIGAMVTGNSESGITVTYDDATGSIVFSVESQTDENFTTADHAKLDGIESGATADQSDAEIKTSYERNADTNSFTDADHTKLDGIESGADVTPAWVPSSDPTYATESYVDTEVSNLVDSAPGALDTLNELAAALGDDPNFATTVTNNIADKLSLAGGTMTGDITMGANGINFDDGATIDVGGGTGTLEVDGTLKTKLEIAGSYSNNLQLEGHGGLDYACRFSGTSGVVLDLSLKGANSYLKFSRSGSYFGASDARLYHEGTGHFSIQDDASNLGTLELADLIASGDISLSDGASITSAGALNIGYNGGGLELTRSGTITTIDFDGPQFYKMNGTTQLVLGGGSGNYTYRNLYAISGQSLGLSAKRWGTAYLTDIDASGDITLSDGATIDVGGGTGDLNITGGDLNFDGQIVLGEGSNRYPAICFDNNTEFAPGLLYNKTSGSTPFIGIANGNTTILSVGRFWAGITTGGQGRGVGFLGFSSSYNPTKENMDARIHRESTGHLSITDENDDLGTLELADLIASGDITLTDGATINVVDDTTSPASTGTLTVDGDLDVSGDITVTGTVDGRDIATDGTKLDGISAGADVTPAWVPSADPSYATETYVDTEVANLVDSAPGTLDTLNELAAALGDDANFSTTVTNSIATKLPLAGGTMSGDIDMDQNEITDVNFFEIKHGANSIASNIIYSGESAFRFSTEVGDTTSASGLGTQNRLAFKQGLYYNTSENATIGFYRGAGTLGGYLTFQTNDGTEQMRLTSNGRLGIGTTGPTAELDVSGDAKISGDITVTGTVDGRDIATDGTKLDAIESGATADQTASEIRTLVDSATDSNVFTDADHTKLNGLSADTNSGDGTDITGLLIGDGSALSAATASEIRAAADLETTDTPEFGGLTINGSVFGGSHISSSYFIGISPNGATTSTDSLRIAHSSGDSAMLLDSVGNDLKIRFDGADKLLIDATGTVLKHDLLSDSSARDIGNSSTGRFGDAYAASLNVTGNIDMLDGQKIKSDGSIALAPHSLASDSLQIQHSGDYMRLNVIGNGLYFMTNSAVRGTMLEAGDLQWRYDFIGFGAANNIGNSTTGRWGTIYGTDIEASGEITQDGNAVLDESYFTPQTLTDGATIAYDVSNGVNAKVTLGGDRTLAAITNAAEGQSGSLTVIQDGTGGRALTLDSTQVDMLGTLADIAGMGANEECEIAWRKTDSTNCKFWITIPA